jgi:uncharacterized protein with PIN domain
LARLYSDENFPLPIVKLLRLLGHDVLTAREAGNANLQIPDDQVLAFAIANERAVLTRNRRHFIKLHQLSATHAGIIVCTEDPDFEGAAMQIHQALAAPQELRGQLIRVTRCSR